MPKSAKPSGPTTTRKQAVDSLETAASLNLVIYRAPYDLRQAVPREALTDALRRIAEQRGLSTDDLGVPADTGTYYLAMAKDAGGVDYPVLLPEDKVAWVMFGCGLLDSLDAARYLAPNPGVLPLDRP